MKTCIDCGHYVHLGEGKNGNGDPAMVGHCFRYPPKVDNGTSVYPVVGAVERQCGEFVVKPVIKKKRK
jgi:hypothetical protein